MLPAMLLTTTPRGARSGPRWGLEKSWLFSREVPASLSRAPLQGNSQPLTQAGQRKVGKRLPAHGIDGRHPNPLGQGRDEGATAGSRLLDQLLAFSLEPNFIAHLHAVPRVLGDERKKGLGSPIYQIHILCISVRATSQTSQRNISVGSTLQMKKLSLGGAQWQR